VSNVLRGVGLFMAKYGFRTCDFAILQAPWGQVGLGNIGDHGILPSLLGATNATS